MKTISDYSTGRDNNLNLIRMIAASSVLIGHAWPLSLGVSANEPQIPGWLASTAVLIFFCISGFLVTRSIDRTSSFSNWIAARFMRLYPGLLVVLLLTVLVLGPAVSQLATQDYLFQIDTLTYTLRNLTLLKLQYGLPGVFDNNPYPSAINGSLWTLVYEVACYGGVFVFGVFLRLKFRMPPILFFVGYLALYVGIKILNLYDLAPHHALGFVKLSFVFVVGMAFYVWRNAIPLHIFPGVIILLISYLLSNTIISREMWLVTLTYWAFLASYLPSGRIRNYNKLGDYSYGIYIYAFPVQQTLVFAIGPLTPSENIMLAAPITLILAVFSWHLVEQPALAKRTIVANWFERTARWIQSNLRY